MASLLHRIETPDDIISDKTRLYAATLRSKKEVEYILNSLEKAIKESKDAPCSAATRRDQMIQATAAASIPDAHFSRACCTSRTTRRREH